MQRLGDAISLYWYQTVTNQAPYTVENTTPEHREGKKDMNGFAYYESSSWNSLEIISTHVAAEKFDRLIRQARLVNFWNRLTGRPRMLMSHVRMRARSKEISRLERGVELIPVKSIVGSVNRTEDYDRQFRPLNPALRKRWVNIHVLAETIGWEPITVYKIGDLYFVEDGHHRVSVARHSGWDTIEAQVYE
jgi:hypothetical protein